MGTLEKLAAIDESDFETLVAMYLRQRDPNLRGLIQTGINAEGKSIKCPVDGVLYVHGQPPSLVCYAATVFERRSDIRRKWLGGPMGKRYEPGDIKKAEDEFKKFEQKVTGAKRKLYLATNRPLESDTDLYTDAVARCKASEIDVEVIEASQLIAFLDHDPEGLYLRQEFFGIDAGRLSESLLRHIARKSLAQHEEAFGIAPQSDSVEIEREAKQQLSYAVDRARAPLVGVRGPSGSGKSTLARQYGLTLNARGGICLWAPADEIRRNVSPAALLLGLLRRFQPFLNDRAGDDALDIASRVPRGIVLLTDDVNRQDSPHEILEALRLVVFAEERGRSAGEGTHRLRFVVPLWPEQLSRPGESEKAGWKIIDLGFYTPAERSELAKAYGANRGTELLTLIDSLNGDPFLCGLALAGLTARFVGQSTDLAVEVQQILDGVLSDAAHEAARQRRINATEDEFVGALDGLVELILRFERPEPTFREIRRELGDRTADLLLVLGDTNRLGWIEQRSGESFWRWKHDRLRDALIGRWLAKNVVPGLTGNEQTEETARLLNIPGAAEAWTWSFAFAAPDELTVLAETLAEHQPLALAEALALIRPAEGAALRGTVVGGLRRALEGFNPSQETFVTSPQWPILRRLTVTDYPIVLEITEQMDRNWHVCLARFRNGDTAAGLWLMNARRTWPPATLFAALERAVESYERVRQSDHVEVSRELVQAATGVENVVAVLTLCGYLGWRELAQTAWDTWNTLDEGDRQATLVPLVWALSRCADETMQARLEEALLRARAWSDEERVEGNIHDASERYDHFVEPLRFVLRWETTTPSAETWARVASEQEDMRTTFLYLLREIDQPAAVEAYVRLTAEFGGSAWDQMAATEHHDGDRFFREQVPVTAEARTRLWEMIEADETEDTRKVAFWLWKRYPKPEDVEKLRGIAEDDTLFDQALEVRLSLRDRTAAPLLVERINADPGKWCSFAYALYHEEGVAEALFDNLEVALESDIIKRQYVHRLPANLPPDGVKRLVREKGEVLRRTPRMWNPLWRSDVPEAMEFLQEVIPQAGEEDLRYMFGLMNGNSYPVSQRMLDAVAPLLRFFSPKELKTLTDVVINAGRADWAEANGLERVTHVDLRSSPDQEAVAGNIILTGEIRHWLNEDDIIATLDAARRAVPGGRLQVERTDNFFEIERSGKKIGIDVLSVLRRWLGSSPELDKLTVASMVLEYIGTGDDVEWWRALEPDEGGDTHEYWSNVLYILRRRRWHRSAPTVD